MTIKDMDGKLRLHNVELWVVALSSQSHSNKLHSLANKKHIVRRLGWT